MKNKIIVPAVALSLLISGTYFTGQVFASRGNANQGQMMTSAEDRQAHQAEMQANFESNLETAVSNGELTAEQKELIVAKHQELRSEHELMREKRSTERAAYQAERQAKRSELETWASENGIDLKYFGQNQKGGGFDRGEGFGQQRNR